MDETVDVTCPYCGEASTLEADPGGGREQEFVNDCPVCCRPWQVRVRFRRDGTAEASASGED
jgi:transposase-like protein